MSASGRASTNAPPSGGRCCFGADYYDVDEESEGDHSVPLGIDMDSTLDKVIVDKNARIGRGVRLVNERGVQEADGEKLLLHPKRHHHRAERRRVGPTARSKSRGPGSRPESRFGDTESGARRPDRQAR